MEKFCWKILWNLMKYDLTLIIVAGLSSLFIGIINIWIPLVVGNIINELTTVVLSLDEEFFWKTMKLGSMLMLQFAVQTFCHFTYSISWTFVEERVNYRLSTKLFKSILYQEMGFFDQHQTGELMNRLTNDTQAFLNALHICLSDGIRNIIQIVGSIILMLVNAPKLTVTMMIVIPGLFKYGNPFMSSIENLSKKSREQTEKATSIAGEAIGNIRSVRALAMEKKEIRLYEEQMQFCLTTNQSLNYRINLYHVAWNVLISGAFLAVGYYGCTLVSKGELSPGIMVVYIIYAETLRVSLDCFFYHYKSSIEGKVAGDRVFEYLNRIPLIPLEGGSTIPLKDLHGNIKFTNVTFSYPTQPTHKVLSNFNLEVPANQTIVLSSKSGGGKSTIASLLARLYDVNDGSITIDGTDIREFDPQWLRGKLIGYISQEPTLFATSIMENIRYGNPEATDEEVKEAAKWANADDFISKFPQGYNTVVGERGVTVSGGQKQRIVIARAFVRNPRILILDEATSALDGESEKLVLEALDSLRKDRTVIIMTHRSGPLQHADLVSTINNGMLIETLTSQAYQAQKSFASSDVITVKNQVLHKGEGYSLY